MNNYSSKVQESREKVYHRAIATKILDAVNDLRMEEGENSERRWVWELIQNAKDARIELKEISIKIDLTTEINSPSLTFEHTGIPFSVDNLTFLIEQVSTKERKVRDGEKSKSTGKFGTGFLATHLLSEKVLVTGIIKEPDLPYKKFELVLDRSGRDLDAIIESVDQSISVIRDLDKAPTVEYNEDEFNTAFQYELNSDGIRVAIQGIEDLHTSLPYSLVFLPEIESVNIANEEYTYKRVSNDFDTTGALKFYEIEKNDGNTPVNSEFAVLTQGLTSIAIEVIRKGEQICIKEIDNKIPKLFCDFPLIGTEKFHFPVVVNNSNFNPTEQRNGVFFSDRKDPKILENKTYFHQAVELYYSLLDHAIEQDWENLHLLAKIKTPAESKWLSRVWYVNEVLGPIRRKLSHAAIVRNTFGDKVSILDEAGESNIFFPYHSIKEIREAIWSLGQQLFPEKLPRKADIHKWYDLIWDECHKLTIEEIIELVHEEETIEQLSLKLDVDESGCITWLNQLYRLINLDDNALSLVTQDEYSIIPNQRKEFCPKSKLFLDKERIEEYLKDSLEILGHDLRKELLLPNAFTGDKIKYHIKKQESVIDEIDRIIKEGNNRIGEACDFLVSCLSESTDFPEKRHKIFNFCSTIWPEDFQDKNAIKRWNERIWDEVDKKEMKWIAETISKYDTVEDFEKSSFSTRQEAIDWLNDFISFLKENDFENLINLKASPILPNQHGTFKIKDDLSLDDGEIDEELKDISSELGYDFREELLDKDIFPCLHEKSVTNVLIVAEKITSLVRPRINEYPRSLETRRIFKKIYLWFNEHKELAEKIFPELYAKKHRFYDDEEIASNMKKAEQLDQLLYEYNITDVETLKEIISKADKEMASKAEQLDQLLDAYNVEDVEALKEIISKQAPMDIEKINITREILVNLGVSSQEELEKALEDKDIAKYFTHTSTPTTEMFFYAQNLIARAKANIIKHLETLPDYDCTELEEVALTVLAGVKRKGIPIHIVTRPADHGEVIIYYSSERDTLEISDAELWVDDNINNPRVLTLGKVLKVTGINRIPTV